MKQTLAHSMKVRLGLLLLFALMPIVLFFMIRSRRKIHLEQQETSIVNVVNEEQELPTTCEARRRMGRPVLEGEVRGPYCPSITTVPTYEGPLRENEALRNLSTSECFVMKHSETRSRHMQTSMLTHQDSPNDKVSWHSIYPNDATSHETDLRRYFKENHFEFDLKTKDPYLSPTLAKWKNRLNDLNLVINPEKFSQKSVEKGMHLPIWLRAHQRIHPLEPVLHALCRVHNINHTVLYVTIDGNGFMSVIQLLLKITCVKIRVYFHPITHNLSTVSNEFSGSIPSRKLIMTMHAIYGLYLMYHKLNYQYVITLEDDIEPLHDFYNYHLSLHNLTLPEESKYLAIASHAHGTSHTCKYVASALWREGLVSEKPQPFENKCGMSDLDQLVLEDYFPVWGVGIPKRLFRRLWNSFKKYYKYSSNLEQVPFMGPWLYRLKNSNERVITPCSNRIVRLDNQGVNGNGVGLRYWDVAYEPSSRYQREAHQWIVNERQYYVLNEG